MEKNDYFKGKLLKRREELAIMIHGLEEELEAPKNPDFEERSVERESDEVMELQVKNSYDEILAIDSALGRIKNNTFGRCLSCQKEISQERLEAVPHALVCRNCM